MPSLIVSVSKPVYKAIQKVAPEGVTPAQVIREVLSILPSVYFEEAAAIVAAYQEQGTAIAPKGGSYLKQYAIRTSMTPQQFEEFMNVAEEVWGEDSFTARDLQHEVMKRGKVHLFPPKRANKYYGDSVPRPRTVGAWLSEALQQYSLIELRGKCLVPVHGDVQVYIKYQNKKGESGRNTFLPYTKPYRWLPTPQAAQEVRAYWPDDPPAIIPFSLALAMPPLPPTREKVTRESLLAAYAVLPELDVSRQYEEALEEALIAMYAEEARSVEEPLDPEQERL